MRPLELRDSSNREEKLMQGTKVGDSQAFHAMGHDDDGNLESDPRAAMCSDAV